MFIHLLITANHSDKKWKGAVVHAGQRVTSIGKLSAECGLTISQTRTALNKLKSTNELTIKTTSKFSLITLVNWGLYQSNNILMTNKITSNITSEITNKSQANDKQIATNKKEKNYKNEKKKEVKEYPVNPFLVFEEDLLK